MLKLRKNKGGAPRQSATSDNALLAKMGTAPSTGPGKEHKGPKQAKRGAPRKFARYTGGEGVSAADAAGDKRGLKTTIAAPGKAAKARDPQKTKLRAELKADFKEASLSDIKAHVKELTDLGILGRGLLSKTRAEMEAAIIRGEIKRRFPEEKEKKPRVSRVGIVPSRETRMKISASAKERPGRRPGEGVFRVAILVDGQFDPKRGVELGPYATARSAAIDAKSVLRTAARVEDHRISQKQALDAIDRGDPGLAEFVNMGLGRVVDGFIVDGTVNGRQWEAWIYKANNRTVAVSQAMLDNVIPPGPGIQGMRLRANSTQGKGPAKRNGMVSFRTRNGEKVSFTSKKH